MPTFKKYDSATLLEAIANGTLIDKKHPLELAIINYVKSGGKYPVIYSIIN